MTVAVSDVDIKAGDFLYDQQSVIRIELEEPTSNHMISLIIRYLPKYRNYTLQAVQNKTAKIVRFGDKTKKQLVELLNEWGIECHPKIVEWLNKR